jgi:hypothetical protein
MALQLDLQTHQGEAPWSAYLPCFSCYMPCTLLGNGGLMWLQLV